MTRIPTEPGSNDPPEISSEAVQRFFEERARKISTLGPLRAVIYQDKHPDLAERRDAAEKAGLLPKLELSGTERLLDVGCGTGRWAPALLPAVAHYHGVDSSEGLVAFARSHFFATKAKFTSVPAGEISLERLGEIEAFDRIFCAGLLIYMNDRMVDDALSAMVGVAAKRCRIVMREPVGIEKRLTLREHYSDELAQTYNAIYRTEDELRDMIDRVMGPMGFRVSDSGDVFEDTALNNRRETRQRWLVVERAS